MRKFCIYALAMMAMTACVEKIQGPSQAGSMSLSVKSGGSVYENLPYRLIFISSSKNEQVGTSGFTPYFEHWFNDDEMDEYKYNVQKPNDGKYQTGKNYPENYDYVYVSGFAPAAESDDGAAVAPDFSDGRLLDLCNNYKYVEVNYDNKEYGGYDGAEYDGLIYDNGKWEGIASAGPVIGNMLNPFDGEEDELKFQHSTFRVRFRAIKSSKMTHLGVQQVDVVVSPQYTPYRLQWDSQALSYFAAGDENVMPYGYGVTLLNEENVPFLYFEKNVFEESNFCRSDYIYFCKENNSQPLPKLHLNLRVVYNSDTDKYGDATRFVKNYGVLFGEDDVAIDLYDEAGNPVDDIAPGQSYLVTIVLDQDSFSLIGHQEDWQDGGNIVIPVPNPVPSE